MTDSIETTAPENVGAPSPRLRNTVLIKCALPHGIKLEAGGRDVRLNGANSATVIGRNGRPATYGITEVDRGFWERWLSTHQDFPAVVSGDIQVVPNE